MVSAKLHTLTVPDFVWMNFELTGKTLSFDYATLEEAVFCQYSYGNSRDLAGQAAQLLSGFRKLHPFDAGNEAAAFVGAVAFLRMNGCSLSLGAEEAAAWVRQVWTQPGSARDAIAAKMTEAHLHDRHGVPHTREIVGDVMAEYSASVQSLLAEEPAAPLA